MATPEASRFRKAVLGREAKDVGMNSFDAIFFLPTQTTSIGTDGLGSCSAVLIVSPYAAILGHVAPRPDNADINDPHAGDNHVRSFMDRLTQYYISCQSYFPNSSYSWVVCAIFGNSVALPDQQNIMHMKLRAVGLNVDTTRTYRVPTMGDNIDRGSVFVEARASTVEVYVEHRMVQVIQRVPPAAVPSTTTQPQQQTQQTQPAQQTQQTQQTPSEWIWSPQYQNYYRKVGTRFEWASL